MTKNIIIQSMSTPDQDGYRDKLLIEKDGKTGFHCQCSVCPNQFRPIDRVKWDKAYGWVACNTVDTPYSWQCIANPKHGKCLEINKGDKVPTRNFDTNNGGMFAVGVLIHCGQTDTWRGSAACITLPPLIWFTFINSFLYGETGLLYISDFTKKTTPQQ